MKSKLVFESDDGVLFDSEDECREWEVVRERIKCFYVNGFLRDDLPAWFSECWDEEGLQFILGLSYAEPKTADEAGAIVRNLRALKKLYLYLCDGEI